MPDPSGKGNYTTVWANRKIKGLNGQDLRDLQDFE
jgi:hypothetical protein